MKNFLIIIIGTIFLMANEAYSQGTMEKDGNWNVDNNWVSKTAAGFGQDVVLNINIDATVISTDDITANSLTMNNGSTITIEAGGKLTIDNTGVDALTTINRTAITVNGELTINGNLVVNNSLTLNVKGDLIINGDVILKNNADLTFDSGSSTIISGYLTAGTNTILNIDGPVTIGGDFDIRSGTINGAAGNLAIQGDCLGAECGSEVLPIQLLEFNVQGEDGGISIFWATATEENFDYFSVERSTDGDQFEVIGTIAGNGNSFERQDYSFRDINPILGYAYYRLKATDIDGFEESFQVEGINTGGQFSSQVSPNPLMSDNFSVQVNQIVAGATVQIYDVTGDLVFSWPLLSFISDIEVPENMENGVYLLTIMADSMTQKHRLVLNR